MYVRFCICFMYHCVGVFMYVGYFLLGCECISLCSFNMRLSPSLSSLNFPVIKMLQYRPFCLHHFTKQLNLNSLESERYSVCSVCV